MLTKEAISALIGVFTVCCAGAPIQNHCPVTTIINHTKSWTKDDQRVLNRAKDRCGVVYPGSPCLKRFDKLAENRYTALCGAKE